MERHEIINDGATTVGDVRVKFIETMEVEKPPYSENDVLRTLADLERMKAETIIRIDAEIELNNQMLLKIRTIDRTITINAVE